MPISVTFRNRERDQIDSIAYVDDVLCSYIGITPDEKKCLIYDNVCWTAIGALYKTSGYTLDKPDAFEEFVERFSTQAENEVEACRFAWFIARTWEIQAYR